MALLTSPILRRVTTFGRAREELADLFFSIPVALELGKPHLAIRKVAKEHGTGGRLVGRVESGQKVFHFSDLITSGKSALDWIETIRSAGGEIAHYFAVFDRGQGGRKALSENGVELHTLLVLDEEFLSFASAKGYLRQAHVETIRRYLEDPEAWTQEFLVRRPTFLAEKNRGRL